VTANRLHRVIETLHRAAGVAERDGQDDAALLGAFVAKQDGDAFEMLVRRHGPMVMGVCRRIVGDAADAEDAFQATFLVLVRKAKSVNPRSAVGNFLYGVAWRTAHEARSRRARRSRREQPMMEMPMAVAPEHRVPDDLRSVLDDELSRLPDKYRTPVVLCELEGRSRKDVARQLGVPEGTLSSRLATARKRLAERLARRGFAAASFGVLLTEHAASASVPPALTASTVHAATVLAAGGSAATVVAAPVAALTEGVVKAMFLTKLKMTLGALMLAGSVTVGGAVLADRPAPANGEKAPAADRRAPAKPADPNAPPAADGNRRPAPADNANRRPENAREGNRRPGSEGTAGTLKSVDAEKNAIVVTTNTARGAQPSEHAFTVAKDAKIVQDHKDAKLGDLKTGARIMVRVGRDGNSVAVINVTGGVIAGSLKSVDASAGSITVTMAGRDSEDKTFKVSKEAKVVIGRDQEGKLGDLKAGSPVALTASAADAGTVIEIRPSVRRE
jgi:RNA polymerase sigma factor (sigma-70 family)